MFYLCHVINLLCTIPQSPFIFVLKTLADYLLVVCFNPRTKILCLKVLSVIHSLHQQLFQSL